MPHETRLRIVSFLREFLSASLRVALGPRHELHATHSVDELDDTLRVIAADIAIVDPEFASQALLELLAVLDKHVSVHVVSYTTVSPAAMRAQMQFALRGHRHLVLMGFDDGPVQFRTYLEDLRGDALGEILLAQLRPALERLPTPVSRAIEELFRSPATIESVPALARLAGARHRRPLHEALARAGWQSAGTLIRAARVVRAYAYLTQGDNRVRDVAVKLGYATARGLANEVRAVSGLLPSSLGALTPQAFLARVVAGLVRPPIWAPRTPASDLPLERVVPERFAD
ncbi:MAG TPA: AraC family transcriptional regulator [Gemmatimonadaceae bacterium]|nr:AraC family transcriptional regulator [Gemmatimonadaceae bacterium]